MFCSNLQVLFLFGCSEENSSRVIIRVLKADRATSRLRVPDLVANCMVLVSDLLCGLKAAVCMCASIPRTGYAT